ncbi:MAG: hypothetical protein KGS09_13155 [Nitrospirae bacterium]|nr:hypothetical protein [Nitrospirota bacterium]
MIEFLLLHLLAHLADIEEHLPLQEVVVLLLSGLSRLFGLFGLSRWPDREKIHLVCLADRKTKETRRTR